MGSIAEKLTYLSGTKQAIRSAIAGKGVAVADNDAFRSYAEKIAAISQGSGGTTDWIAYLEETLLETETASEYRHIQLVTDRSDTLSVTVTNGNSNMVWYTSDGAVLPWVTGGITHTWDRSKDIAFNEALKCRWIICSQSGPDGYPLTMDDALYSVVDRITITNNSVYKGKILLRGVKFIHGAGWKSTLTSMSYAMFNGCSSLNYIDGMDFQYVTSTISNTNLPGTIVKIRNISGINVTFVPSSSLFLDHDSLLSILNGLVDQTGQEQKVLQMGTRLLDQLSEAEKSIAVNKNWELK